LRKHNFSHAILLKNSFMPALAVFLAGVPARIGYNRYNRGFLLTEKLNCPGNPDRSPKPRPMIDYYLTVASFLGGDSANRKMELSVDANAKETLRDKFPQLQQHNPVVILVPGGAYGSAKCWPSERFAETANWLRKKYNATIFISAAPNEVEITRQICKQAKHNLINLAESLISLGQLKALFASAELIITNDTGPRHIGLALDRKTISLFGPNDPEWTRCDCENETQIVADVPCAPCDKGKCPLGKRVCMESITTEMVCTAAEEMLEKS
jgi:heptosyltransferase II